MRHFFAFALLFLFIFLLSGCTLVNRGQPLQANDTITENRLKTAFLNSESDLICKELNTTKPCYCFVCENKTTWVEKFLNLGIFNFYDATLKNGECRFDFCNATTFDETLEDASTQVRVEMFSVGPSFASTGKANLYCNYTLQMATKWLLGKGAAPQVPSSDRAICWLDRNSLPLYIYYTNSSYISPSRTYEIAEELAKAGPVMMTTELDFDNTNPAAIASVESQLEQIRAACPKCLSVLAVKSRNWSNSPTWNGIKDILGTPGPSDDFERTLTRFYNMTDMIGFGFRANDYEKCSVAEVVGDNYMFSRAILRTYRKPTIWLYVGASEGNSSDGSCTWDAQKVHSFYQNIFAISQGMASSGIVGASFYEFRDGTGPLPCNGVQGCKFGLLYANGTQKHPELNTWSELCKNFGTVQFRPPLVFSRNSYGSMCDFAQNTHSLSASSIEINTNQGLNYSNVTPQTPIRLLSCGEICVSDEDMPDSSIYDNVFADFSAPQCTAYPEIDDIADDADFSALYFRSTIKVESNFDFSAVSCVNATDPNIHCNPLGFTMAQICSLAGDPVNCPSSFMCSPGEKPCAFGMAQCIEYPGKMLNPIPASIANCGGTDYNPFDPGMSLCCGTNKFRAALDTARKFVRQKWSIINTDTCSGGLEEEEKDWAAYFLASVIYNHGSIPSINDFVSQRDDNGNDECSGEEHFIKWVYSQGSSTYGLYAKKVMSTYLKAIDVCESECPGD